MALSMLHSVFPLPCSDVAPYITQYQRAGAFTLTVRFFVAKNMTHAPHLAAGPRRGRRRQSPFILQAKCIPACM